MASTKQYAYYIEGNKYAIVEKDVSFDNDVTSKEYGPGASRSKWVSPKTNEVDALKVKYVYPKDYRINVGTINTQIDVFTGGADGYLRFIDASAESFADFSSLLSVDDYFVLDEAEKFNGLYKVRAFENYSTGTNNSIVTNFLYSGFTVPTGFEESTKLYYNVSTLNDESFDIDLPLYLQKALVYYVKGKFAEDAGDLKLKMYFDREFKKMVEKHENSKISGLRIISPGSHSIR